MINQTSSNNGGARSSSGHSTHGPSARRRRRLLPVVAIPLVLAISALGLTAVVQPAAAATTSITLDLSDSTFIMTTEPSQVHNIGTNLFATRSSYSSFLKFDTTKLGSNVSIKSVNLSLYTSKLNNVPAGLEIHPTTNSWASTTLTANNRPVANTTVLNTPALPKVGAVTSMPLTNMSTISTKTATSVEIRYNQSNPNFTFYRTGVNAPKLIVTVASTAPVTTSTSNTATTAASAASSSTQSAQSTTAVIAPTTIQITDAVSSSNSASSSSSPAPTSTPPATTTGTPPADSGAATAIDLPGSAAHKKLVFAHYWSPGPISLDNQDPSNDYWARNYLQPTGENNKWATAGGLVRDRPITQDPVAGDYELRNIEKEVKQASDAGIDGFSLDILEFSGMNWTAVLNMMNAAHTVNPDFKIMLMPDMSGNLVTFSQQDFAKYIAQLAAYPAAYHLPDGRLLLSPFNADRESVAWWTQTMSILATTYGIRTALLPVLLDPVNNFDSFAAISYGLSEWGVRQPKDLMARYNFAAKAHASGKIWMAPIAVQDVRPRSFVYNEADNTETLRTSWLRATSDGADMAQMVTWNDYTESTSFGPSMGHGYSFLDINAYYMTKFQTGADAPIVRDAMYVTHRIQMYQATPTYTGEILMKQQGTNPNPARNTVEVLTFLTAPAVVAVTIGSNTYSYPAPAGVFAQLYPLDYGTISASATRSSSMFAQVHSPYTVTPTPYTQDLSYYGLSSRRPNPSRNG